MYVVTPNTKDDWCIGYHTIENRPDGGTYQSFIIIGTGTFVGCSSMCNWLNGGLGKDWRDPVAFKACQ